jgi:hypothetical protein
MALHTRSGYKFGRHFRNIVDIRIGCGSLGYKKLRTVEVSTAKSQNKITYEGERERLVLMAADV